MVIYMKATILKIFLSLLITTQVFASATLESCFNQASLYGSGMGQDKIDLNCTKLIESQSNYNQVIFSKDNKTKVIAHRNLIVIEKITSDNKIRTDFIAGQSTGLKEIKAIALDENHEEVIVLNGDDKVFFFSSVITGNVSPYRILSSPLLGKSFDIEYIASENQVAVASQKSGKVHFFSRKANIHAPKHKRFLEPSSTTSKNFSGHISLANDQVNDVLYVLDNETKTIFSLKSSTDPLKEISTTSKDKIDSATSLRYSYKLKKLVLKNERDESFSIDVE